MKKLMVFAMLSLMILTTAAYAVEDDILFGSLRTNDPIKGGDYLITNINLVKDAGGDLDNVRVRLFLPELGVVAHTKKFDFEQKRASKLAYLEMPEDVEPGLYLVRLVVSGDNMKKRIKHRFIEIE